MRHCAQCFVPGYGSLFGASRARVTSSVLSDVLCVVLLAAGPREYLGSEKMRAYVKNGGGEVRVAEVCVGTGLSIAISAQDSHL